MKALTVWQPWASLIIAGAKPYEFRRWRTPRSMIGPRIVIHAAARTSYGPDALAIQSALICRFLDDQHRGAWTETCLIAEKTWKVLGQSLSCNLPLGVGLGTAVLGEPRSAREIAEEFGIQRANDSDRDEHAQWGWPVLDIEPWSEPIPMRGQQGFWNWPTTEANNG